MEPIENEPKGWEENRQNNASDFGIQTNKETKAPEEVDDLGNDLSGNASGNVPEDDQLIDNDQPASDQITNNDPRGFMGDFAEPQHDEEV